MGLDGGAREGRPRHIIQDGAREGHHRGGEARAGCGGTSWHEFAMSMEAQSTTTWCACTTYYSKDKKMLVLDYLLGGSLFAPHNRH